MALDPNIILRGVQSFQQPDVGAAVQQGLQNVGIFQQMRNEQALAPLRQAVLERQATGQALANQQRQAEILEATRKRDLRGLANSYLGVKSLIDAGKYKEAADKIAPGIEQSIAAGQTVADMSDSIQAVETLRSGDAEGIAGLIQQGKGIVEAAEAEGLVTTDAGRRGTVPAAIQEFQYLSKILQSDDPRIQEAAAIQLGLSPDAGARIREKQLQQQAITKQHELNLKQQAEQRQQQKISATLEKALLTAQDESVNASRSATEFDILADQVEELDLVGGVRASTSETLKQLLGTQDDVTELRRRFNKVRLSEGLKNLPPGPATDRDVKEAFKGVPPENAPASQIASFLRGASKMARFDAAYNQFKSDFISDKNTTKGINREWRKKVRSDVLDRDITIAEIYAEAVLSGLNIEDIKAELGVSE